MDAIMNYFRGSLEELRHVQWPTQQQALRLTGIVIAFIIVNSIGFGLVDALFAFIIRSTL